MPYACAPVRRTTYRSASLLRRRRATAALLAVAAAALVGLPALASAPSKATARLDAVLHGAHHGPFGAADGALPDGASPFADDVPGVTNLDPALLAALRQAASDAASAGVRFTVNSGWRSAAYQEELRREAIARYGSAAAASRWVATGSRSAHVRGDAVDVGPAAAAQWLADHGAAYGLCRIYANEAWHYELRPAAREQGCPALYADAAHDPRLQR